jgi:ABC-type multidrug transport system permease subunit
MTALTGTLRMTAASTKQIWRAPDVLVSTALLPMAFLAMIGLFKNLTFETSQSSIDMVNLMVTGLGLLMVSMSEGHVFLAGIATYKATGVLKRISVTPVSPVILILGEVIPRVVRALLLVVAFFAVGSLFGADILIGPQLLGLLPVALLSTGIALSWAFVIAGTTASPANANAMDTFTMFPMFLFTGAMFPLDAFPSWLETAAHAIPYTGLIEATRGITLRAQPVTDFGPELAIGAGWLILLLALAARAYRFTK